MSAALGIRTVSSALQSKITRQDMAIKKHKATTVQRKAATRKLGARLASRTKRVPQGVSPPSQWWQSLVNATR